MGKRVRFTVCRIWGNDRQNSGLVNFVPESRFTIYHFYRVPTKLESPFGTFRPEIQDYLFRCSVVPGNFQLK